MKISACLGFVLAGNAVPASSFAQSVCPVLETPLVSHYTLDDVQGGVLHDATGLRNGSAYGLSSEGGLVDAAGGFSAESVATVSNYDPALSSGVSVSLWVNPQQLSGGEARFVSKATGVEGKNHYLMAGIYNTDALRFRLKTNGQTTTLVSPRGVLVAGQWQYVTFTYDGQRMRIYRDGEQVAQVAKSGGISGNAAVALALGNQPPGAGMRPFTGMMDDVRIYDGALSEGEIARLMAYRSGDCQVEPPGDQLAPPVPGSFQATALSPDSVLLSWTAVQDEAGGSGLRGYHITRDSEMLAEVAAGAGDPGYTDTTVIPETIHVYAIKAIDNAGNESAQVQVEITTGSSVSPDTEPPSVPGTLVLESASSSQVVISWQASTDMGGSGMRGYRILRNGVDLGELLNTTGAPQFIDTDVVPDAQYAYEVSAIDGAGNASAAAELVVDTPPGEEPGTCVLETPLVSHYTLDDVQGGVLHDATGLRNGSAYGLSSEGGLVDAAGGFSAESVATVSNYDPALSSGVSVSLWVNPQQLSGGEARFVSKATGVEGKNHYLMAGIYNTDALRFRLKTNGQTTTLVSPRGVLVAGQWQYVTFTYDGQRMRIYRDGEQVAQVAKSGGISGNAAVALALGNQPPGAGMRPFTGMMDDVRIYDGALSEGEIARLMAYRSGDCQVEPPGDQLAPPVPGSFQATALSPDSVLLSWTAVQDEAGGSGLRGYHITRDSEMLAEVAAGAGDPGYTDTTVIPETIHVYAIKAIDNAGNESAQVQVEITTGSSVSPDTEPPSVPGTLVLESASSSQVVISWQASTDMGGSGMRGYRILRNGVDLGELLNTTGAPQFIDTDVVPDAQYTYEVSAIDGAGNASAAAKLIVDTPPAEQEPDVTAPPVPSDFGVSDFDSQSVRLNWTAVIDEEGGSGLSGYEISRDGIVLELILGMTAYADLALTSDTEYSYTLVAVDRAGNRSEPATVSQRTGTGEEPGTCVLETPLVSHYSLDDVQGGVLHDVTGLRNGSAYGLSSEGGLVDAAGGFSAESVATVSNYDPALSSGVSVSLWVNPQQLSGDEARFVSKATGVEGKNHYLMAGIYNTDALRFRLKTNGQTTTLVSPRGVLVAGQWQYVTFTYDGQRMRIYRDGEQVAQVAKSGGISGNAAVALALGNQPPGAGMRPFTGMMDDVRIYDGALSEGEIARLMAYRSGDCQVEPPGDQLAPPVPGSFQATALSPDSVLLSWTAVQDEAGGSGLRGYLVQHDGGQAIEVSGTSHIVVDLEPETNHEFSLKSQDNVGNVSAATTASIQTPGVQVPSVSIQIVSPSVPASLSSGASTQFTVQLSDNNFDSKVVWHSDKDGQIGVGASIVAELGVVGSHVVTASVADADGSVASDQVVVNVSNASVIVPKESIPLFDQAGLDQFYTWHQHTGFGPTRNIIEVVNDEIRFLPVWNPELPNKKSNGSLITNERYANYVLVLEFRWGDESLISTRLRDAGLIFHSNGEVGAWEGRFMPGLEVQKAEGEMGDLILLNDPDQPMSLTTNVEQVTCVYGFHCRGGFVWNPLGTVEVFTDLSQPPNFGHIHNRVWDRSHQNVVGFRGEVDYENPTGDWNQFVVVADGNQVTIYFNGQLVNSAIDLFPADGHLQLQLEWTEYFVRRFELLPLASNVSPVISTYSMASARSNQPYEFKFDAEAMNPPVVWSLIEKSTLPEGLALDPVTGVVSGIPAGAGEFDITVRIDDAAGLSRQQPFVLSVQ